MTVDPRNGGRSVHIACKGQVSHQAGVAVVRGSQQVTSQCLVVTVDKRKGQTEMNGSSEEVSS